MMQVAPINRIQTFVTIFPGDEEESEIGNGRNKL